MGTKGEVHGVVDGTIMPASSISFTCSLTLLSHMEGILYGGMQTGLASPVSTRCSTTFVRPILLSNTPAFLQEQGFQLAALLLRQVWIYEWFSFCI